MRSVRALPGFVDTAVGMHDGVLDEVDAGSGGIMELRDGERGMEGSAGPQEGPGDQVFSINSGVSRAGREAPSLPAWLLECASKTGDRGGEYCSEVQW